MMSVIDYTYFKALRGVNWWPVVAITAMMFVGLGFGSYFLQAHLINASAPATQRPFSPSKLHEDTAEGIEPEQIFVPVDSVDTVAPVEGRVSTPAAVQRTSSRAPNPAEVVQQINEARRVAGVAAVKEDAMLNKSAMLKVSDMIGRNYWSHSPPDESGPFATIRNVGYVYSYVGENLAYGDYGNSNPETTIVQNWLKSSGHRKNMLNSQFNDIGIAVQKAQSFNGNEDVYVIVTQYATKR